MGLFRIVSILTVMMGTGLGTFAKAQSPFSMKYVDEIGHMDSDLWGDHRKSIDLGIATAHAEGEDELRIEGRDDAGKQWRLSISRVAGLGGSEVWTADFDHNGRQDLLITQYFPQNGRCIDEFNVVFLLLDKNGQPHASSATTHSFSGFEEHPKIIVDLNHNGRAELILNSCEYADPPRFGEDRWITGIFEARDAEWVPLRSVRPQPYVRVLESIHPNHDPEFSIKILPAEPNQWLGSMERVEIEMPAR